MLILRKSEGKILIVDLVKIVILIYKIDKLR
jgi:hypothetical protein